MIDKLKFKTAVNDEFKYMTKLLKRTTFSFLKINIIGFIGIAILCFTTIVVILSQTFHHGGGSIQANGESSIAMLFKTRPIALGLTIISVIVSPILLFSLGNKYVVSRTINRLISEKGGQILSPIIDSIINKVKAKQPQLFQKGIDKTKLQLTILQEINNSKENKWFKKIISYGLKKVDINGIGFNDENFSFSDVLKNKIMDRLQDSTEPSRLFFYLILGFPFFILVLTIFKVI